MNNKKEFVENLAQALIKLKIVQQKEAEAMKKDFYHRSKESFDYFLLDEGLITKDELLRALSEVYKVPYFDVTGYFFDHDLLTNFPKDFLLENIIIPSTIDSDDFLIIVANNPDAEGLESKIRNFTNYDVVFLVGEARDIIDNIREYYDEPPRGTYIHDMTDEDEVEAPELEENVDVDDLIDKKDRWQ